MKKRFWFSLTAALITAIFVFAPAAFAADMDFQANGFIVPNNAQEYNSSTTPDTMKAQSAQSAGLPASYDLRALGQCTTVKMQGSANTCWSFAALASMESSILKQNKATGTAAVALPDLSEHQIDYFVYQVQNGDGIEIIKQSNPLADFMQLGGSINRAIAQIAQWDGVANESSIPYTNKDGSSDPTIGDWTLNANQLSESAERVSNSNVLSSPARFTDVTNYTGYWTDWDAVAGIKQALMNTGAVAMGFHMEGAPYMSSDRTAIYTGDTYQAPNHGVTIVGWDDDYPATNFNAEHRPPGNGAWLIKNSYGDYNAIGGYNYVSYYEQSITMVTSITAEQPDATTKTFAYDHNYQYDYLGQKSNFEATNSNTPFSVANVFTATSDQSLKAVSAITVDPDSMVSLQVNLLGDASNPESGTVAATKTVLEASGGYHTITLDTPVTLKKGQAYSVIETIQTPSGKYYLPIEKGSDSYETTMMNGDVIKCVAKADAGQSYVKTDGAWADVTTLPAWTEQVSATATATGNYGNVEIKAFTTNLASVTSVTVQPYDASGKKLGDAITTSDLSTITLPAGTAAATVSPAVDGGTWTMTAGNGAYSASDKIPVDLLTNSSSPLTVNTVSARNEIQNIPLTFTVAQSAPAVTYEVHSQNLGWSQGWVTGPATGGTTGKALRAEAIRIKDDDSALTLSYRVHVQNDGWSGWVAEGGDAGTTGRALRMEAIEINATGADAAAYTVQYRVHVQNSGWTDWVDANSGSYAGTTGKALRMEAVQIQIVKK